MSATNHTTNYSLPQFIGTDKPTWLTDVNGALSTIDGQMKLNADAASTASSTATSASTAVGTIANLNTTDKTSAVAAINEVNTNLGTVSGVASGASGTATEAKNATDALARYLTLTDFNDLIATGTGGITFAANELKEAVNADGTVGKVYGTLRFSKTQSGSTTITVPTSFRPDTAIAIDGVAQIFFQADSTKGVTYAFIPMNVATNGNITFTLSSGWYGRDNICIFIHACMLFFKDFGDEGGGV